MYTYDYRTPCLRCVVGVVSLTLSHYIHPKKVPSLSPNRYMYMYMYMYLSHCVVQDLDVMVDAIHFTFEPHTCICYAGLITFHVHVHRYVRM